MQKIINLGDAGKSPITAIARWVSGKTYLRFEKPVE